mmetsp:Transcript_23274/g.43739  ORF Transcript_23274/g.43739 Transcript_23274/m.43739 type:complete len:239 (-) Transcript_23274:73-789(-)
MLAAVRSGAALRAPSFKGPVPQLRTASEHAHAAPSILIASATGDISKLSGAVAARLRDGHSAKLSAIGPQAVQTALRSIARSTYWLGKEKPGEEVLIKADRQTQKKDSPDEYVEMRLDAQLWLKDGKDGQEESVPISAKTNTGNAAAFVAARLAEDPTVTPALRSVGALAASQAVKALVIARTYVAKAHPGEDLLICLREQSRPNSGTMGSIRTPQSSNEMVFACKRKLVRDQPTLPI